MLDATILNARHHEAARFHQWLRSLQGDYIRAFATDGSGATDSGMDERMMDFFFGSETTETLPCCRRPLLLEGVVGGTHQRAGLDVPQAHLFAQGLVLREFVGVDVTNDWQVLAGGLEVLAER